MAVAQSETAANGLSFGAVQLQNGATTFALFKKAAKTADRKANQAKQTVRRVAPKKAPQKAAPQKVLFSAALNSIEDGHALACCVGLLSSQEAT